MEQYLFNLSGPSGDGEERAVIKPNVWLMSADDMPPLLFTPEEVARFLGIGRCRVYDLLRQGDLTSVKVGSSRRVSARALSEYVARLELGESA
jgi:excisionase family DNA binding protein